MSLCRDMMPPWEMKAEMDRQAAEIERLRAALREIVLITDRKHDAWDRAKLLLGGKL